MSDEKQDVRSLIRDYLLDEGLLRNKLKAEKLDFGFQFSFPPGKDPSGRQIGKNMIVAKPEQKDFIIIEIGTQISKPHQNALNSLEDDKKMQFFMDLRKFFLLKNLFFNFDLKNYRYKISDQIFLDREGFVKKNQFFKSVRLVFNCAAYSNIILGEYCSGKVKPEDLSRSKDFSSGSNFSLYS